MWKDILKYKATVKDRERFYRDNPQFDNDKDRAEIKRHALAWNKAHVKDVTIDFYGALEHVLEEYDLNKALKELKIMYSSWRSDDDDDDGMEDMERRSERSADAYFSGHGYNTGDY